MLTSYNQRTLNSNIGSSSRQNTPVRNQTPTHNIWLNTLYKQIIYEIDRGAGNVRLVQKKISNIEKNIQESKNKKRSQPSGKKGQRIKKIMQEKIKRQEKNLKKIKRQEKNIEDELKEKEKDKQKINKSIKIIETHTREYISRLREEKQRHQTEDNKRRLFNPNNKKPSSHVQNIETPNVSGWQWSAWIKKKIKTTNSQREINALMTTPNIQNRLNKGEAPNSIRKSLEEQILKNIEADRTKIKKHKKNNGKSLYINDNIKLALHYFDKGIGLKTQDKYSMTTAKKNTSAHTIKNIQNTLMTMLSKIQNKKNDLSNKKIRTHFHIFQNPKTMITSPPRFIRHIYEYPPHNINKLSTLPHTIESGRYIPKTSTNFKKLQRKLQRSNSLGNDVKINTSRFKIPEEFGRHGVKKLELLYDRIFKQVSDKLNEQKKNLINKNIAVYTPELLKNFIHQFLNRQTIHVIPDGLTGQMFDVVIHDIQDLCNFLYIQKRDMEHDFTGERFNKAIASLVTEGITNVPTRSSVITAFVKQRNMKTYLNDYIKPNIVKINGRTSAIDDLFKELDKNINRCFVSSVPLTGKEDKFFEKVLERFEGQGPSNRDNLLVHTKKYGANREILGDPNMITVFDMDSTDSVKFTQNVSKKYIDLSSICDAGSSFKDDFIDDIVEDFKDYLEIIQKVKRTGKEHIHNYLLRGLSNIFINKFQRFYGIRIRHVFKLLDDRYIADKFIDFVKGEVKKSKLTNNKLTDEIVLKLFMTNDNIYIRFIRHMNTSSYIFDFSTMGTRVYYKPPGSNNPTDVILINDAMLTINQYHNAKPGASIINGQNKIPVGSSLGDVIKYIVRKNLSVEEIYPYLLAKTYGDFFLMIRGLTKRIKYVTNDKMAASTYLVFADILKNNTPRLINYINNKTLYEPIEPRVQMFVGSTTGDTKHRGTRYMYIDSGDKALLKGARNLISGKKNDTSDNWRRNNIPNTLPPIVQVVAPGSVNISNNIGFAE